MKALNIYLFFPSLLHSCLFINKIRRCWMRRNEENIMKESILSIVSAPLSILEWSWHFFLFNEFLFLCLLIVEWWEWGSYDCCLWMKIFDYWKREFLKEVVKFWILKLSIWWIIYCQWFSNYGPRNITDLQENLRCVNNGCPFGVKRSIASRPEKFEKHCLRAYVNAYLFDTHLTSSLPKLS